MSTVQGCGNPNRRHVINFGELSILPLVGASLALILIAMSTTYLPARRASRIDPLRALREE
jgi:ABC-type antimicrobial peptide transport system permease subunit